MGDNNGIYIKIQADAKDAKQSIESLNKAVKGVGETAKSAARESSTAAQAQARAFQNAAGATARGSKDLLNSERERLSVAKQLSRAMDGLKSSVINSGAAWNKFSATATSSLDKVKAQVFSIQSAIVAIGVGAAAQGMIRTAASFENLQLSLETITGSSQKAKEAMDWITEFTASTPYELEEVANAFKKLSAYGLEPTRYLKTLGDTAAAMGKRLDDAVEAFADAATGEFERLKEFGIKAKTEGDKVTLSWVQNGQQMSRTIEKTGTVITQTLGNIWSDRFSGGMERLSKGWAGMWSNLQDQITLFSQAVMESGVFDYMKERLSETLETLTRMTADGSLKEMASDIGQKLTSALDQLWTSLKGLIDLWNSLPSGTSSAASMGILGNLLFGPKGAAIIGGGTYLLQSLTQSVEGFKRSMSGDVNFWEYMFSDRMELEGLLDKADQERLEKQRALHAQMDALDAERTKNLEASYKSAHSAGTAAEQEYASKVRSIQTEVTLFRDQEWDKIEKDIKAHIADLIAEEEKYAKRVEVLDEKRRLANSSTEEKIRAMMRGTMTEQQAYQDKQAEANESLAKARQALISGDGGQAEFWAKKAQDQFADLTGEVKEGERVIISAAQAQATAVQGVRDAGKALNDAYLTQRRVEDNQHDARMAQLEEDKRALQSIKDLQEALGDVEMLLSVKDGASPTLEDIQLAADKLADIKMKISAVNNTATAVDEAKTKTGELPEKKTVDINAEDNSIPVIHAIKEHIGTIPDKTVDINATDQASPVVQGAAAVLDALPDTASVDVTAKDNATGTVRWVETETGRLLTNKTMQVNAQDNATGQVRLIETETGLLLTNKSMDVSAQDKATEQVRLIETETGKLITNKVMDVEVRGNATEEIDDVIEKVEDVPEAKSTTLNAKDKASDILNKIQSELAQIKDKTVTVTVRYRKEGSGMANGGLVQAFAEGGQAWRRILGKVVGPGTSTSDSIFAKLSNGEFVIRAAAVRKFGASFFEALNRGFIPPMPRFAMGGPVNVSGMAPRSSETVNLNFRVGEKEFPVRVMQDDRALLRMVTDELSRTALVAGR